MGVGLVRRLLVAVGHGPLPEEFAVGAGEAHHGPPRALFSGLGEKDAVAPDEATMLVLTSGYNRNNGPTGASAPAEPNEYVFIFDIAGGAPVKQQVIQVPNTFNGLAWTRDGSAFYVSGGVDDNVHVYKKLGAVWAEDGSPIPLGHSNVGVGLSVRPAAAGLAVNNAGDRVIEAPGGGTDLVRSSINYTLGVNVENLILTGTGNINGTGNGLGNFITGNSRNNILDGRGGDDSLNGGAGNDFLNGGAGNDTYVPT